MTNDEGRTTNSSRWSFVLRRIFQGDRMRTQIRCPQCQAPVTADIHQIIDVGQNPELKQALLGGYLNVAACQNCGMTSQLATPMLYHDPAHELFMIYVPMELNLSHVDREKLIGQLVKQAMDNLPAEQRRGYMLQPQNIISMQTFMEKALETEGITPEMIARQRKQMELVQTLATADKEVTDILLKERANEIDEAFLSMVQSAIGSAEQAGQEEITLKLINLRARLMRETAVGQQIEKRQQALHAFSRAAKKQGALTPELLLEHIILNLDDDIVVAGLINMVGQALDYNFFTLLSETIEAEEKAGRADQATKLSELRQQLLDAQEEMRQESQKVLERAGETLRAILTADDPRAALQERVGEIDEPFMYLLSANIEEAQRRGHQEQATALQQLHDMIMAEAQQQMPPEVQLLNHLIQIDDPDQQRQALRDNPELVTPEFVQIVKSVAQEVENSGQPELIRRVKGLIVLLESEKGEVRSEKGEVRSEK
jgi:hypothetical protein